MCTIEKVMLSDSLYFQSKKICDTWSKKKRHESLAWNRIDLFNWPFLFYILSWDFLFHCCFLWFHTQRRTFVLQQMLQTNHCTNYLLMHSNCDLFIAYHQIHSSSLSILMLILSYILLEILEILYIRLARMWDYSKCRNQHFTVR